MTRALLHLIAAALVAVAAPAQSTKDCGRSSFGLVPLDELSGGSYRGEPGGLYSGSNSVPVAHLAAGIAEAALVVPRAADGRPAVDGRIALLSIGMSNTTQEFSTWMPWSAIDPQRNPALTIVDGAQGGQDARVFADPNARAWTVVEQRLAAAGVTPAQVQVVWIKQAMAAPTSTAWPAHVDELRSFLGDVVRNVRTKFPACRIAFLSSRSYGGYSPRAERSEPLSYETAFAVRELILDQVGGDPTLAFDPSTGSVRTPWLAWGPYFWADGVRPRADGLRWLCEDFQSDGVHPNAAGRLNVADRLDLHFRTHPVAVPWYLGGTGPARGATLVYGDACPGAAGPPLIRSNGDPTLGNGGYLLGLARARPNALAVLFVALGSGRVVLSGDPCRLWVDPGLVVDARAATTNGSGSVTLPFPVPNDAVLVGARVFSQWAIADPAGATVPGVGAFALTAGMLSRVGVR